MTERTEVFSAELTLRGIGVKELETQLRSLETTANNVVNSLSKLSAAKIGKVDISSAVGAAPVITPKIKIDPNIGAEMKQLQQQLNAAVKQEQIEIVNAEKVAQATTEMNRLQDTAAQTVSVLDRFKGTQLLFAQSGARLQGLREIFGGTSASANFFVKALDGIIRTGQATPPIINVIERQMLQLAQQADNVSRSFNSQVNVFRQSASAMNVNKVAVEELAQQGTRVTQAFQHIQAAIMSGKDAGRGLNEARIAIEGLKTEAKLAGLEQNELFRTMLRGAEQEEAKLQALAARQTALTAKAQAAIAEEKKAAAAAGLTVEQYRKQNTVLGRTKVILSETFRGGKKDIDVATSSVKKLEDTIEQAAAASNEFRANFLGNFLGQLTASAFTEITQAIGNFARQVPAAVLGLASRAEESMNKFNFLFDTSAATVEADMTRVAAAIGRGALDMKEQAGFFAGLFDPMIRSGELAREEGANFSTQLAILTSDLASFFNTTDEQAMNALRSGLIGESEPLRNYNVLLSEAKVNTELMALGIAGGSKAATEEQKVLARLNIIMRETKAAQGDAARTSEGWANQTRFLQGQLTDMGAAIGTILMPAIAPFLQILNNIILTAGPTFLAMLQTSATGILSFATVISTTLQQVLAGTVNLNSSLSTFIGSIVALFSGDWATAWDLLQITALNGVSAVIVSVSDMVPGIADIVTGLVDQGFSWGYSFMAQIGQGILDAAGEVLDAVIDIANQIASFLAPGSPPKQGPLSSLDKWGTGLMGTWQAGFFKAGTDTSFMTDLLGPVSQALSEFRWGTPDKSTEDARSMGKEIFRAVAKDIELMQQEFAETGAVGEDSFNRIATAVKSVGVAQGIKKQIEQQGELAKINKEIAKAEAEGFVPAALKAKKKAIEDQIEAQKEQEKQANKLAQLEERALGDIEKGDKLKAAAAAPAMAAANALRRQADTAQETYDKELELIDARFQAGETTEEEYLKARIAAAQKWLNSDENTNKEGTIAFLKEQKERLAAVQERISAERDAQREAEREARRLGGMGDITGLEIPDLLGRSLEQGMQPIGERIGQNLTDGITGAMQERLADARSRFVESMQGMFQAVVDKVKEIARSSPIIKIFMGEDLVLSDLPIFVLGSTISTIARKIILSLTPVQNLLARFSIFKFTSLSGLSTIFSFLIKTVLKFSVIGIAVFVVWQNWETILAALTGAFDYVSKAIADFTVKLGGSEKAVQKFNKVIEEIKTIFNQVTEAVKEAINRLFSGESLGDTLSLLFSDLAGIDTSALVEAIRAIFLPFNEVSTGRFDELKAKISGMVGPDVVNAFVSAQNAVTSFFTEEGRLGFEILRLFGVLQQIRNEFFSGLIGQSSEGSGALGQFVGAVVGGIALLIKAGFSALGFLEKAVAGIVRAVTGIIQVISGAINLALSWISLIMAVISGEGIEAAVAGVVDASERMAQGIADIFIGIVALVTNLTSTIYLVIANFGTDLINALGLQDTPLGQTFLAVFENMRTTAEEIGPQIVSTVRGFVNKLLAVWGTIGDGVQEVLTLALEGDFEQIFQNVLTNITNILLSFVPDLPGLFALGANILTFLETPIDKVQTAIESLILKFQDAKTSIGASLEQIKTAFAPVSEAFAQIKETFITALTTVQEKFASLSSGEGGGTGWFTSISSSITSLISTIASFLPSLESLGLTWENAKLIMATVGQVIGAIVILAFHTLIAVVIGVIGGIAAALTTFVTGVTMVASGISTAITGIITIITGLRDFFVAVFSGDFPTALAALGTVFKGVKDTIAGIFEAILGLITTTVGTIGSVIVGFIAEFIGYFVELYNELVGGSIIPDMIADILAAIATFGIDLLASIGTILVNMGLRFSEGLTDIVDTMFNFGVDIVNSLIDGVNSSIELVSNAVDNIRGYFPFSPAKYGPLATLIKWSEYIQGDIDAAATPVVNSAMAMGISVGQNISAGAVAGFGDFPDRIGQIGQSAGTTFGAGLTTSIAPAIDTLKQDALGFFTAFDTGSTDSIAKMTLNMAAASGQFTEFFARFGGDANQAFQAVRAGAVTIPQELAEFMATASTDIQDSLDAAATNAEQNSAIIAAALEGNAQQLESTYATAAASGVDALSQMEQQLGKVQGVTDTTVASMNTLGTSTGQVGTAGAGLGTSLQTPLQGVETSIGTIPPAWDMATTTMTTSFQTFISTVQTGISAIVTGISGLLPTTTTMVTTFTAFLTTTQTGIIALQTAWITFLATLNLQWTTFLMNLNLLWDTFVITTTTIRIPALQLAWTMFMANMLMLWTQTITMMTELFQAFSDFVLSMLQMIGAEVVRVTGLFAAMGEAAFAAGERAASGMEKAAESIKSELIPALTEVIDYFDRLKTAALDAASAISDVKGASSSSGGPSVQHGTMFVPRTGQYTLHRGEAVVRPEIAPAFREFVTGLNQYGLGGKSFNIPLTSGGLANAEGLDTAGGGDAPPAQQTQIGPNYIQNGWDEVKFREKVLDVVTKRLPR